jgi:hypothetical protein
MLRPDYVSSKGVSFLYSGRAQSAEATVTRDEFVEDFYTLTGRRDIKFGEATWLSKYTCVHVPFATQYIR